MIKGKGVRPCDLALSEIVFSYESTAQCSGRAVRPPSGNPGRWELTRTGAVMAVPLRLRQRDHLSPIRSIHCARKAELRLSSSQGRSKRNPSAPHLESDASALSQPQQQRISKLWGARDYDLRRMGGLRSVQIMGADERLSRGTVHRTAERRRSLLARQLSLGGSNGAEPQQAQHALGAMERPAHVAGRGGCIGRVKLLDGSEPTASREITR